MEAKETKGTLKRTSRNYNDNVKKKKNKTPKNTQKNTQQNTENKRLSYTKTTKKKTTWLISGPSGWLSRS